MLDDTQNPSMNPQAGTPVGGVAPVAPVDQTSQGSQVTATGEDTAATGVKPDTTTVVAPKEKPAAPVAAGQKPMGGAQGTGEDTSGGQVPPTNTPPTSTI